MKIIVTTHTGRRKHNEDVVRELKSRYYHGVLVSDGMGGALAGEVAAAMVADGMEAAFKKLPKGNPIPALLNAIREINRKIYNASKKDSSKEGMGATLVMALTDETSFWVVHVGDSRCYRLKDNEIQQITRDHSAVQDSIDRGVMSEEEARKTPWKNALLQCMGSENDPIPGVTGPEPFLPGTILLLCSDGLSGFVSEIEILETVANTPNISVAATQLIRRAWYNGSDDNISVCLMENGSFNRNKKAIKLLPPIPKSRKKQRKPSLLVGLLITAICLLTGLLGFMGWLWMHKSEKLSVNKGKTSVQVTQPAVNAIKVTADEPGVVNCWLSKDVSFKLPLSDADRLEWRREGYKNAILEIRRQGDIPQSWEVRVGNPILLSTVTEGKKLKGLYTCVLKFDDGKTSPPLFIMFHNEGKADKTKENINSRKTLLPLKKENLNMTIQGVDKIYMLPLTGQETIHWHRPGFTRALLKVVNPENNIREFQSCPQNILVSQIVGVNPIPGTYRLNFIFPDNTKAHFQFTLKAKEETEKEDTKLYEESKQLTIEKNIKTKKNSTISVPTDSNKKKNATKEKLNKKKGNDKTKKQISTKNQLSVSKPNGKVFYLPIKPNYTLTFIQHNTSNKKLFIRVRLDGEKWGQKRLVGSKIKLIDLLGRNPKAGKYEYQLWYAGQQPKEIRTFYLKAGKRSAK